MLYSSHSSRIADKFVYLKFSSADDAVGSVHVPGEAYKGDSKTAVLEWRKTAYSSQEIVAILLSTYEPEQMCVSQPNVSHNVSFLARSLQHKEDLKCDDIGAWKDNGSPKCGFHVENNSRDKKRITAVDKKSNPVRPTEDVYELRRAYYKNSSDSNARKIVSKLYGMYTSLTQLKFLIVRLNF